MNSFRPRTAAPRTGWQSIDFLVTLILLVIHIGAFMFSAYFSLLFQMAVTDCYVACEADHLGAAYVVTDGGGLLAVVTAIVVSSLLLARRRPAFWVPLLGIAIQVALLMAGVDLASSTRTI